MDKFYPPALHLTTVKFGLLADVHANLPALRAALSALDEADVRTVLCASDLVGYGPHPGEVLDLLRERGAVSIVGNHDRAVATGDARWFNAEAALAVGWTRGRLSTSDLNYLGTLPASARLGKTTAFHGHPLDPDRYVLPEELQRRGAEILDRAGATAVVLGHTHIPALFRARGGVVVNPGAAGQPRDGDPRAACAVLETGALDAEFLRLPYPVADV